jgi:transcriptional regulator with PAS, ATPase and Fis domain
MTPVLRDASSVRVVSPYPAAIGSSPGWRAVLAAAFRVATTETTVLLQGESGTGKEVVARLIHQASQRRQCPFVAVNCAAVPEQLLESELFGYERGAFTGAVQSKTGQIELAARGVLFLDEVSEMSLTSQAKVLRFLEEREFRRLGGIRLQKADVRIIAASNRDLADAVERETFRQDLLYRLQVFDILLPPLRDRVSDVPLLAEQFLADCARTMGRRIPRLLDEALDALLAHDWPGNVRELRNVLERASILTDGDIECRHLSLRRKRRPPAATDNLQNIERATIERVLDETNWNKARAARRLGLTRTQLYGRLRRYKVEPPPPFTDSGSMRPSVHSQGPRRLDRKHVFPSGNTKAGVQRAVEQHRAEDLHKHRSL